MTSVVQAAEYKPIETIKVSGGPHDRGYAYGRTCKQQIGQAVDSNLAFYKTYCNFPKATTLRLAHKYAPFIQNYSSEIDEEITAIAEGAERPRDAILMLTCYWELMYTYASHCTAIAVTGSATVDGETYVAQNNDEALEPWGSNFSKIVVAKPQSGPSFLTYTYPGFPGQMGLNSNGIALCVNALITEQHELGVPFQVITSEVLRQKSIGDAINAVMRAKKRASSGNLLIADENGEIYDLETTPHEFDALYSYQRMVHTNHFLSTRMNVKRDVVRENMCDTVIRYNRMSRILEESDKMSIEGLMHAFKDHVNYPNSICRHVDERQTGKDRLKTADCMIYSPSKKRMWLARGNPCGGEFQTFGLS